MRHSVYGKKLGRNKNQRTALFKSLVQALFLSESIETTKAKAQSIKGLVDKLINQAKHQNTRRLVGQFLIKKEINEKLDRDLLPRLSGRNSGYTSTVKLGYRQGDGTMMVKMSLLLDEPKGKKSSVISSQPLDKEKTEVKDPKAPKGPKEEAEKMSDKKDKE